MENNPCRSLTFSYRRYADYFNDFFWHYSAHRLFERNPYFSPGRSQLAILPVTCRVPHEACRHPVASASHFESPKKQSHPRIGVQSNTFPWRKNAADQIRCDGRPAAALYRAAAIRRSDSRAGGHCQFRASSAGEAQEPKVHVSRRTPASRRKYGGIGRRGGGSQSCGVFQMAVQLWSQEVLRTYDRR